MSNSKYYPLYMKYKAKYLSFKNKLYGGQVIFDLEADDFLNDNSLEDIYIKAIDKSNNQVLYEKIIEVKKRDESGIVYSIDYESGNETSLDVNRGEIEKLMEDIKKIWELPASGVLYSGFLLYIKLGNKVWTNSKRPKVSRLQPSSSDQQDIYNDIMTSILSFEG